MRIQPSMLTVPLLAIMLTSAVVKTVLEPSSDARLTAIARSVHVAQLPAPTGHRQPTLNDLPPGSVRKKSQVPRHQRKTSMLAVQTSSKAIGTMENDERRGRRPMTVFPEFVILADIA